MSVPAPVIHVPDFKACEAAVRAMYALGFASESGRTVEQQARRIKDSWDLYRQYPYIGVDCYGDISWKTRMPSNGTLVNLPNHLKTYAHRHGLILTRPPA